MLYPSITTVLSILSKDSIDDWKKSVGTEEANRISTKASSRGTRIHSLSEAYLKKEPYNVGLFDREIFNSFKPILDNIKYSVLETSLFSDRMKIAGTVDCIGYYKKQRAIIDFKTSKRHKTKDQIESYFLQATGYSVMWEEISKEKIDDLFITIAVDNDEPQVFHEYRKNWINKLKEVRLSYYREHKI